MDRTGNSPGWLSTALLATGVEKYAATAGRMRDQLVRSPLAALNASLAQAGVSAQYSASAALSDADDKVSIPKYFERVP